jgi:F-type H+-transporting ATPase subunit epsilon
VKLQIATPEKIVFDAEADDLLLNAEKGQLNILERHANFVSFLQPGPVTIKSKGKEVGRYTLSEGVMKVEGDQVTLLCPQVSEA